MAGASSGLLLIFSPTKVPILAIHLNARATPAVRCEIARSREPTGMLAGCYGIGTETTIHKR